MWASEVVACHGAGGEDDLARLGILQRHGGQVRADVGGGDTRRENADHLAARDELEFVLDGIHQWPVGCAAAVGPGIDAPEGIPFAVVVAGDRFVGDVVDGRRSLPARRWSAGTRSMRGLSSTTDVARTSALGWRRRRADWCMSRTTREEQDR